MVCYGGGQGGHCSGSSSRCKLVCLRWFLKGSVCVSPSQAAQESRLAPSRPTLSGLATAVPVHTSTWRPITGAWQVKTVVCCRRRGRRPGCVLPLLLLILEVVSLFWGSLASRSLWFPNA